MGTGVKQLPLHEIDLNGYYEGDLQYLTETLEKEVGHLVLRRYISAEEGYKTLGGILEVYSDRT